MNYRWAACLLLLSSTLLFAQSGIPHKPARRPPAMSDRDAHRVPDRVIVKFKPSTSASYRAAALARQGLRPIRELARLGALVVTVPPGETPESVLERLKTRYGADLEYAHPDWILYAAMQPNDPLFPAQYHHSIMHAPAAWDVSTGQGIRIGIADTGVEATHPDLAANLITGFNTINDTTDTSDNEGHGTLVAGTVAAVGNNSVGVIGTAFQATLIPLKISDDGSATTVDIAEAITYAADNGIRVVNLSFAFSFGCETGGLVAHAAGYLNDRQGWVVQAAGNIPFDKGCQDDPEIIAVSATNSSDQITSFSTYGTFIDVSAPGQDVVTTATGGTYAAVDGTSFAAPLTSAVLGLIFEMDPSFTSAQAQQILFDSSDDLGASGKDILYGWGRVNAERAVRLATERSATFRLESLSHVYVYPSPWDIRRHSLRQMTFANLPDSAEVNIYTVSGFSVVTLHPSNGRAVWDLRNRSGEEVASGLYFYQVTSGGGSHTKGKFAIIK